MAHFITDQVPLPNMPEAPRPNFRRTNPQAQAARPANIRTNLYGAKCVICSAYVPEGEGTIRKNMSTGRWEVLHIQPCPDTQAAPVADEAPEPATKFAVPDGRYTVIWGDHYKTIRVEHQDEFATFMPGKIILKFLSGSNNDRDYTSFGHVDPRTGAVKIWTKHQGNATLREAVKVLLGDPKAASMAYAKESECCSRCGRSLTVPASLHAGLGPECAKKVTW